MSVAQRPLVLFVDDEASILSVFKRLFRKEPWQVMTAANGAQGLAILREHPVQVIVSDQRMPEMDGVTFLKKAREVKPEAIRIMLTGYTDVDALRNAVNAGYLYKIILKPWNDDNLLLEIRQALEQYRLVEANRLLSAAVQAQNERLLDLNARLESLAACRADEIVLKNRALELSQVILSELPFPLVGVGMDGIIAMTNRAFDRLFNAPAVFKVGNRIGDEWMACIREALTSLTAGEGSNAVHCHEMAGVLHRFRCFPLSGAYEGQGVVMIFEK